jgi:hypothetical protein
MAHHLGKKRKRKRLKDIQSFEVAGVTRGANGANFVVLKSDSSVQEGHSMKVDLKKLDIVQKQLAKVITVCKAGEPSAQTAQQLGLQLREAQQELSKIVNGDAPIIDVAALKEGVADLDAKVSALAEKTNDLNKLDEIEALQSSLSDLGKKLDALSAQQAAPEAAEQEAAPAEETAEAAESVEAAATDEAEETEEAPADEAEEAEEPAAEEPAEEAEEAEEPAADAAEAEAAPEVDVVTKSDMDELMKGMSEQLLKQLGAHFEKALDNAIKPVEERMGKLEKKQKAAENPLGTVSLPTGTSAEEAETKQKAAEGDDDFWGNPFNLNDDSAFS